MPNMIGKKKRSVKGGVLLSASPRDTNEGRSVEGMGMDVCTDPIDVFDQGGYEDLAGAALGHGLTFVKDQQPVGVLGGEVEVVEDGEDGGAAPSGLPREGEDLVLVRKIEGTGGLVEEEGLARKVLPSVLELGKHTGELHPLLLASGKGEERPVCQMSGLRLLEAFPHNPAVLAEIARPVVGHSAEHGHIEHRVGKGDIGPLGEDGEKAGAFVVVEKAQWPAIQADGASGRPGLLGKQSQECRLSRAVGAEDGEELASRQFERNVGKQLLAAAQGITKSFGEESHSSPPRSLARSRSQRK